MVYYLKYRPQTLAELIGQETVKQILAKASQNGQLAHAYLFCGPKGTGKTSTARILAKIVNCEKQGLNKNLPCNSCPTCLSITDGSNLDFIEIDAASNRGIDDIRQLRENIKLASSQARKKVYVIDEVHMLTPEAFNALLKTLEEPPSHVLFILATTEAQKIPETILSRVQRLDFQLATSEQLLTALQNVVDKEKLEIEMEALQLIAKRADGSFRDCLKLLDQLASRGEKITLAMAEDCFKSGKFDDVTSLIGLLNEKNSPEALKVVLKLSEDGINIKGFIEELLDTLRNVLLLHHGAQATAQDYLGSAKFQTVKRLAAAIPQGEEVFWIEVFQQALNQMKIVSIPSLPLEIAVVEICQTKSDQAKSQIVPALTPTLSDKTKEKLEKAKIEGEIPEVSTVSVSQTTSTDLAKLLDKWNYILETVKPYNYSLEALLRQVKVISCEGGQVVLEVPYSFHQRILEAPKSRDLLESVISDVLDQESKVSCVLGARPVRVEEIANVEVAADDEIIRVAAEIFNSESVN